MAEVDFFRILLVARRAFRRLRVLPSLVVPGYELGGGLGLCEIMLAMDGVRFGGRVETARLLGGSRVLGAIDFFCRAPRGFARQVRRGKLTAEEPLSFVPRRRFERAFELTFAPFGAIHFVPSLFDAPQRFRERADLLVDGFFADSPERVERVFSRHNV
jgi:hypothetical protein